MISCVVDVHRNILSAQCFLRFSISNQDFEMRIVLNANGFTIYLYSNSVLYHKTEITTPCNLFMPTTVTCLKHSELISSTVSSEGDAVEIICKLQNLCTDTSRDFPSEFDISFRLQILNNEVIENTIIKSIGRCKVKHFLRSLVKKNTPYNILCASCEELLTSQPLIFENIFDYNEEILELSDTWFCHKQNDCDLSELKRNSLYVNDRCLYFHYSVTKTMSISINDNEYRCNKCSSVLSALNTSYNCSSKGVGFFGDKIRLQSTEIVSFDNSEFKIDMALNLFHGLIENHLESSSSYKLFFQSKMDGDNVCLLLWITPQKVAQFLLQIAAKEISAKQKSVEFKMIEVFKVLYCITTLKSDLVKSWKHDFNVGFYIISDNTMKVVTNLLRESSKRISTYNESDRDFSLGYLPAFV